MSFLSKIFGKKMDNKTSPSHAIRKLKDTEDMLLKKQNFLESKIEKEKATAKNNAAKNKKAAIHALQRKKRFEKQLQQIDGALNTIEFQRDALECATTNTTVLSSIKNASEALKTTNKQMNIVDIDELLGNLADQNEQTEDISNALSQPTATFGEEVFDEEELEKELRELELGDIDELQDIKLPCVPHPSQDDSSLKAKSVIKNANKSAKEEKSNLMQATAV